MNFKEYQDKSRETAIYPNKDNNFIYPVLGLVGESGEVAEKIKKVLRDNNGIIDEERKQEIKKELGDVLWYIAQIATELNLQLDEIACFNIEKLKSRKHRNQLHGSGDNR
ncbi:MAG: nucleoside triphosphate pyrophosphohydrolase family protein [Patescibacteria group bacterium]|nr:nucleoside triphosphate pyrophosphohydrolase family protein [Patescibacteria group bacterium]